MYPYCLIPALPKENKSNKFDEESLQKLLKLYNRFFTSILKNEVLKSCPFTVAFFMKDKEAEWSAEKNKFKDLKFSKNLSDVVSVDGQVSVVDKKESYVFCSQLKDFVQDYSNLTSDAISLSKEVHYESTKLA